MKSPKPKFELEEIVYHKMDTDAKPGMITRIVLALGTISYSVQWSSMEEGTYYQQELDSNPSYGQQEV